MIYVEKGVICMRYAAVMFDVIESRKYSERYEVQQMLMNCIDYLNGIYRDSIKKEVVSSAGDEFQGLFLDLQSAFVYIRKLQILIYPIKIRCGIGYGAIKYDVEEWTSAAFDGEDIIWQGLQLFQLANKKIMRYVFIQNLYMTNI